jgi:ABC-type lipoprotein export system ATPase subunit
VIAVTEATERLAVVVSAATKIYSTPGGESVRALDAVSLEIRSGEMVALAGPSGCGKSTLLNLIGCIDLPTSGTVAVGGRVTSLLDDDALTSLRRDAIGMVFQFFNLLPAMTVAENVGLPLVLQRCPRSERERRVAAALGAVDIADKATAYPAALSGGQMQRAAVARATVHHPQILLADEPTGNLDSHSGAAVLRLLRDIADSGQAVLMATHAAEAAAICDRVVRMQDGRIV